MISQWNKKYLNALKVRLHFEFCKRQNTLQALNFCDNFSGFVSRQVDTGVIYLFCTNNPPFFYRLKLPSRVHTHGEIPKIMHTCFALISCLCKFMANCNIVDSTISKQNYF